jgi:toxin FitB
VLEWLRSRPITALFATTITEAELYYGLALLPKGKRRRSLESIVEPIFTQDLAGRVLPFDSSAAREYANIAASRRHAGRLYQNQTRGLPPSFDPAAHLWQHATSTTSPTAA